MILLFLTLLLLIYLKLSLFCFSQIILALIIFFTSSFLIRINPWKIDYYLIKWLSLFSILILLYLNTDELIYSISFIMPLSKDKISLLYNFPSEITYGEFETKEIKLNSSNDLFKNNLTDHDNYVGYFTINYQNHAVFITISEFFLFNKYSNSEILENYIEANVIYQESLIEQTFKNKYNREAIRITLYYSKFEII